MKRATVYALWGLLWSSSAQPTSTLSATSEIFVRAFQFEGNTLFSATELNQVIAGDYQPQTTLTAEQLQAIKNKITQFYINQGYINSGAIIPDQTLTHGIVHLHIIEGKLVDIHVNNPRSLQAAYLKKRLEFGGEILNIHKLQERLQLLQQHPLIQQLTAELGPGVKLGEASLSVTIEERQPLQLQLTFSNHRAPSIGAYRGEVEFWHHNLTGSFSQLFGKPIGRGDFLYLRYGLTEGLKDYSLRYLFPLNARETQLAFSAERSDSEVVEEPFKQINIESQADTYAVALTHPFYKTPAKEFTMGLRLEKRASKTWALNHRFSFSPGVQDGESRVSVVRFSQDWLNRSRVQVLAARSILSLGIEALGATLNEEGTPDSRFVTWTGQFQWVRRLDFLARSRLKESQLLFRTDLQWANEDLLPLEKLAVGGATTVRGYRENFLTRDRGLIASLEWRLPLWQFSKFSKNPEEGWWYLAPFYDYGVAWNAESSPLGLKRLYSVGLGLRWSPSPRLHAEVYWGKALRPIESFPDRNPQDNGIHFEWYWQWR